MGSSMLNKVSFCLVAAFVSILLSCSDDAMLVGKDLLPPEYNTNGLSTLVKGVVVVNTTRDSIKSDQVTSAIFGELKDESFGKTKGSFVAQVYKGASLLDTARFNLPGFSVDSLILQFSHLNKDWYGDGNTSHTISVFELNTLFPNQTEKYYSNTDMTNLYYPTPIGVGTLIGNSLLDSAWAANKNVDMLKIKLNDEIKNRFFTQLDSSILKDNSKFLEFFKGIYMTAQINQQGIMGSLVRCNVDGSGLGLRMYYKQTKKKNDGVSDTILYFTHLFPITKDGVTINKYEHELSANISLDNPDATEYYSQGMAGSYLKVILPMDELYKYGDSLKISKPGERLTFSSVTLEFFVDTLKTNKSIYPLPESMVLYRFNDYEPDDNNVDQANDKIEVPYFYYNGEKDAAPVVGGVFNAKTNSYKFTISNAFFEHIVSRNNLSVTSSFRNDDDFEFLYIGPSNPIQNFKRVIFKGQNIDSPGISGIQMKIRTVKF